MQRIDVHRLADEARFTGFHRSVVLWCFAVIVLDGYDLAIVGAALPKIMEDMGVEAATAGFMASSALFGMMFGAIALGSLADKIGRRWAISICVFLFSAFTVASGLADDPITFSVLRFIAGLGIGGAIPNVAAQLTEYMPKKVRGVLVTMTLCGYAVGSIIAALFGKQFIESIGWQSVFIVAGAPILLIPFILRYMPESLTFLVKRHDESRLRAVVAKIRPDVDLADAEFAVARADKSEQAAVSRLFAERRGSSTVMFWLAGIIGLFMLYALSNWLVKLMGMAGYSLGSSLNFLLAYNVGGIVGAVIGGRLADRFAAKWVTFGFFILGAISLTLLGFGVQPLMLVVAVAGASTLGTQILLYAYTAQFYPASIRATGLGFATGVGRIGAISAPILIGFLVAMELPLRLNFLIIGSTAAIGAVAIALVNDRLSAARESDEPAATQAVSPQASSPTSSPTITGNGA